MFVSPWEILHHHFILKNNFLWFLWICVSFVVIPLLLVFCVFCRFYIYCSKVCSPTQSIQTLLVIQNHLIYLFLEKHSYLFPHSDYSYLNVCVLTSWAFLAFEVKYPINSCLMMNWPIIQTTRCSVFPVHYLGFCFSRFCKTFVFGGALIFLDF